MRDSVLKHRGYSVAAMRQLARRRLPRAVFDFVDGGAEDEVTLQANEMAFRDISLLPNPLQGTTARDQSIELFGKRLLGPVLIGPTGLTGMLWPRGEIAAANAAAEAGTVYTMSHGSTVKIEDLAAAVQGNLWLQVFPYKDRGLTENFVARAHGAGYQALVLTIDNQVLGQRERDLRNGFTVPPRFGLGGLLEHGFPSALDSAHGACTEAGDGQLRARGRNRRVFDRRACQRLDGSERELEGGGVAAQRLEAAAAAQGRAAPGRGPSRRGRGDRRDHRQQPWRTPARRCRVLDRGLARDRGGGRREESRSCSTAASVAAPTSSRRWRWVRPPA